MNKYNDNNMFVGSSKISYYIKKVQIYCLNTIKASN